MLALSGCERSGRACSQAARNLVMLAFPGYKGPGRTCPPKKEGLVVLALTVAGSLLARSSGRKGFAARAQPRVLSVFAVSISSDRAIFLFRY